MKLQAPSHIGMIPPSSSAIAHNPGSTCWQNGRGKRKTPHLWPWMWRHPSFTPLKYSKQVKESSQNSAAGQPNPRWQLPKRGTGVPQKRWSWELLTSTRRWHSSHPEDNWNHRWTAAPFERVSPHNRSTAPQLRCKLVYNKQRFRERCRAAIGTSMLHSSMTQSQRGMERKKKKRKRQIHQKLPDLPASNILSVTSLQLSWHLRVSRTAPNFVRPAPEPSSSESFNWWKAADGILGVPNAEERALPQPLHHVPIIGLLHGTVRKWQNVNASTRNHFTQWHWIDTMMPENVNQPTFPKVLKPSVVRKDCSYTRLGFPRETNDVATRG